MKGELIHSQRISTKGKSTRLKTGDSPIPGGKVAIVKDTQSQQKYRQEGTG